MTTTIENGQITTHKTQRKHLTVSQSKLGVTLVISKDDCTKLGYDIETATTKQVADELKKKLGL